MIIISASLTKPGQPSPRCHVEAWLPFRNCEMVYLIIAFDEGERILILLLLAGSILMPSFVGQFSSGWNMSLDSMLLWPWWHSDQCRPCSSFVHFPTPFLQLVINCLIFKLYWNKKTFTNLHVQSTIYIYKKLNVFFSNKYIFDHCRTHSINLWLLLVEVEFVYCYNQWRLK